MTRSAAPGRTAYLLERAWVDGAVRDGVRVEVESGLFTSVQVLGEGVGAVAAEVVGDSRRLSGRAVPDNRRDPRSAGDPVRLPGLTLPGLANCHSHAFHRALRGRTQRGRGTFWTWREQMYAVAAALDPDTLFALARATYREMAAAGITAVGEFHYLHHRPDGTPHDDPAETALALVEAARGAGIRIALLDTAYLSAGFGTPVEGVQRRFTDGSVAGWARRTERLVEQVAGRHGVVVGAAAHSVRAVGPDDLRRLGELAAGRPLHVHLSEQVAENDACVAAYGVTPARLLHDAGLLRPGTTLVHATHLTDDDVRLLGAGGTYAAFCPTTERDLGDGIGPSRRLHDAGARLTLGSDSHAVIDLFEEMRAVELDERLATRERGHWTAAELLTAANRTGQESLGFADAGRIAVGCRADLVTIDTDSPRTAGTGRDEHTAVFAATAEDVTHVVVDGRVVVRHDDRVEIGRELDVAVEAIWRATQ